MSSPDRPRPSRPCSRRSPCPRDWVTEQSTSPALGPPKWAHQCAATWRRCALPTTVAGTLSADSAPRVSLRPHCSPERQTPRRPIVCLLWVFSVPSRPHRGAFPHPGPCRLPLRTVRSARRGVGLTWLLPSRLLRAKAAGASTGHASHSSAPERERPPCF